MPTTFERLATTLLAATLLAVATVAAGCGANGITCSSAADCVNPNGGSGVCEPTGFCSYEDASCPSGRRYGPLAGKGLASACVYGDGDGGLPADDMGLPPTGPAPSTICGSGTARTACSGQYLFCDSFEKEKTTNLSSWSDRVVDGSGAKLETCDAVVCRGALSLKAAAGTSADAHAFVVKQMSVPSTVYLRTAVYVEPGSMPWVNLIGLQSSSPSAEIALRFTDKPGKMTIARDFGSSTQESAPFDGITPGRWSCVEMRVDTSNRSGRVTVSIDGKRVADLESLATIGNGASHYDQVLLGIDQTEKQPSPTTWYFDELAISTAPIGCD
jgi:hypothetical protein